MKKSLPLTIAAAITITTQAQNVGIGEANPANKLSVKGNLSIGSGYSTTAAPADGAIIEGRVGIGTSSPSYPLTVERNLGVGSGQQILAGFTRLTSGAANGGLLLGYEGDGVSVVRSFIYAAGNQRDLVFQNFDGGLQNRMVISGTGQVGIGTITPDSKSILDVQSTTRGVFLARMTTAQRNAISGLGTSHTGLTIYNTDNNRYEFWDGDSWEPVGVGAGGPPTGPAGGALTGTYPNPGIATGAVTTTHILDGTITSADMGPNSVDLSSNVVTNILPVNRGGTGLGNVPANRMLYGDGTNPLLQTNTPTAGQVIVTNSSANPTFQTLSGDVTINSSAVTTISNDAVTSAKIANGTIVDADISNTAAISRSKIAAGTPNHIVINDGSGNLSSSATVPVSNLPNLAGDVTGPINSNTIANDAVTSAKILDGTIADADLSNSGVTAGTYTKVTVNAKGRVTSGGSLSATDIPAGSDHYIQNQNSADQTANFRISGTGRANTSFQSPVYTRADAGTVAIRPNTNSTTAIQLQDAGGTSILNIDATNGRVGIGNTNPDHLLVVGPAGGGRHLVINDVATARWGFATGGHDLAIQNDWGGTWNTRMLLTETGDVGIGTTTPTGRLDIKGGHLVVGTLYGPHVVYGTLGSFDTRTTNPNPETYNMGIVSEFKENAVNGLSDGGSYNSVLSIRQWSSGTDWSGGGTHQLGFTQNGNLWHRYSQTTGTWGPWRRVLYTTDIPGGVLPVGTAGQTLRHDGSSWVANSFLFNNGSQIGIGTTSPAHRLDVQGGNARINNVFIGDVGHGATWGGLSHSGAIGPNTYAILQNNNGEYTLINKANTGGGYIGFRVGNVDQAVLLNNGFMGIGTTAPNERLEVAGNLRVTGHYDWFGSMNFRLLGNNSEWSFDFPDGDGNDFWHVWDPANGPILAVRNNGRVGIGTITPAERLHVNGNVRISNLAGIGNRRVYADPNGTLTVASGGAAEGAATVVPLPMLGGEVVINSNTSWQRVTRTSYSDIASYFAGVPVPPGATRKYYLVIRRADNQPGGTGSHWRFSCDGNWNGGNDVPGHGFSLSSNWGSTIEGSMDWIEIPPNAVSGAGCGTAYWKIDARMANAGASMRVMSVSIAAVDVVGGTTPAYSAAAVGTAVNPPLSWLSQNVWNVNDNIGIGTANPENRLHVVRPGAGTNYAALQVTSPGDNSWGHVALLRTTGAGQDGARLLFHSRGVKNWSIGGQENSNNFGIWEDGGDGVYGSGFGTQRMRIEPGGAIFGKFRHVTYHGFNNASWSGNPANAVQWFPCPGGDGCDDTRIAGTSTPGNDHRREWVAPYSGRIVRVIVRVGNDSGSNPEFRGRVARSFNGNFSLMNTVIDGANENAWVSFECNQNNTFNRGDRIAVGIDMNCGGCYFEDTNYFITVLWEFDIWD